jgi:hypothetical protein
MNSATRRDLLLVAALLLLALLAGTGLVIDQEFGRKLFIGAGLGLLGLVGILGLFLSQGWFRIVLWVLALYPLLMGLVVLLMGGVIQPFEASEMLLRCGIFFWPAIGCVFGEILNVCRFSQIRSRRITAWRCLALSPLLVGLLAATVAFGHNVRLLEYRKSESMAAIAGTRPEGDENRHRAFDAVRQSTRQTLQKPRIYDATVLILVHGQKTRTPLWVDVFWVSDSPKADGIKLWLSDGETAIVPMLETDVLNNKRNSDTFVTFSATLFEDSAKQLWRTFAERQITEVALTAAGQQITDAFKIRDIERD